MPTQGDDSPRRSSAIIVLALGLGLLVTALFVGAASLTGVEPPGLSFVDCGAAVFGRPDPAPHPSCSAAYRPLVAGTWILTTVGAAVMSYGIRGVWRHRNHDGSAR